MKKVEIFCPTCKKPGTWKNENTNKPFCSERCKLIDLGNWASEQHRIPENGGANESVNDATHNNDKSNDEENPSQ